MHLCTQRKRSNDFTHCRLWHPCVKKESIGYSWGLRRLGHTHWKPVGDDVCCQWCRLGCSSGGARPSPIWSTLLPLPKTMNWVWKNKHNSKALKRHSSMLWLKRKAGKNGLNEGCLSIPDAEEVKRQEKLTISYQMKGEAHGILYRSCCPRHSTRIRSHRGHLVYR